MLAEVSGLLERLHGSRDAPGVLGALLWFSSALGFEEVVLARFRPDPVAGELRPAEFEATDPEGVRRYTRLMGHDPVLRIAHRIRRPKLLHVERLGRMAMTPEQEQLWHDPYVRSSALRALIPVTEAPDGGSWSVVFGSAHRRMDRREVDAAMPLLWLAAAAAGARASVTEATDETEVRLSPRERECLLRLARGDRVDRIAERMALSNASVELYLAKARRKLGARTSAEAVAKAVLGRIIRP